MVLIRDLNYAIILHNLGIKFKSMRELKKFKSKIRENNEEIDESLDDSETSFSDILKFVKKEEKGKIKKKKVKKVNSTTTRYSTENYQCSN